MLESNVLSGNEDFSSPETGTASSVVVTKQARARGRWRRGVSGNPKGRPRAAYSGRSIPTLVILEKATPAIIKRMATAAKAGDVSAARLILGYTMPKERMVRLDLPPIETAADALTVMAKLIAAAGSGALTPGEASALSTLARGFLEIDAMQRLEERIAQLEAERSA